MSTNIYLLVYLICTSQQITKVCFLCEECPDQQFTPNNSVSGNEIVYSFVQNMITRDFFTKESLKSIEIRIDCIHTCSICKEYPLW